MRWWVERLFQDDFVQIEDDVFVYYPNSITGPGYIMTDCGRDKFLSNYDLTTWALLVAFVFPNDFVASKLLPFQADSLMTQLSGDILAVALFLIPLWFFDRRATGFLDRLDRRSPDSWDEDIRQLQVQEDERESKPRKLLPILGLIFVAALVAGLLEGFLFSLTP